MNILYLSRWYPYPADNGAKIRTYNLLKQLARHHTVDLISFTSDPVNTLRLDAVHAFCRRIETTLHYPYQPRRWKALLGIFSTLPRSYVDTYSLEMQRLVEQATQHTHYDVIMASQIDMTPYATRIADVPKIFEEIELSGLYEQYTGQRNPLRRFRYYLTWWKTSRYVAHFLNLCQGGTVVSAKERQLVCQVISDCNCIHVVPNGVDITHYDGDFGQPKPDTLVYSGALSYKANFDAVKFFLQEVFPKIQAQRPAVQFYVTGQQDQHLIKQLPATKGVFFTGYLEDIRPFVACSWVSVVPLRLGGGTRLKILEALTLGTPVVATSKGAEGLLLTPGCDLFIADDPTQFAESVVRLLSNASLRNQIGKNGRQTVIQQYDWASIGQQLDQFVNQVVAKNCSN